MKSLKFLAAALIALSAQARAAQELVILDNDFYGPGGCNIQAVVPLLADPKIKVLGFTVVTGDGWRDEEAAHLLRFLEVAHAGSVPVANGAVYPLINTRAKMQVWEKTYGKLDWKGAWNEKSAQFPTAHPDDPTLIPPLPGGMPKLKPSVESAVGFLIRQVHQHPHEVTIMEAGPMTNLALAIRIDPEFAALAKQLIFMGAMLDTNLGQVTANADFNTDFNLIFDPEAAQITLSAPWAKITAVGTVSNDTIMTKELVAKMVTKETPVTRYLADNALVGLPLWDELPSAIFADPSLVTGTVEAYLDVDLDRGYSYGHAHVWPESTAPHLGERKVTIVTKIDQARFVEQFVKAAQSIH